MAATGNDSDGSDDRGSDSDSSGKRGEQQQQREDSEHLTSEYGSTSVEGADTAVVIEHSTAPRAKQQGNATTDDDDDDDDFEETDYYWDTTAGVALAKNYNSHCLTQIHKRIAWSGALGLILSAAERQRALSKGRSTALAAALAGGFGGGAAAKDGKAKGEGEGEEEEDGDGEDPVVHTYAVNIVRQLTLDIESLAAQQALHHGGGGGGGGGSGEGGSGAGGGMTSDCSPPRSPTAGMTHRNTCPLCRGLSTTFTLP